MNVLKNAGYELSNRAKKLQTSFGDKEVGLYIVKSKASPLYGCVVKVVGLTEHYADVMAPIEAEGIVKVVVRVKMSSLYKVYVADSLKVGVLGKYSALTLKGKVLRVTRLHKGFDGQPAVDKYFILDRMARRGDLVGLPKKAKAEAFSVGDKVRIKKKSRFYRPNDPTNPTDTEGSVSGTLRDKLLPIIVVWVNGTINSYDKKDLELVGG